MDIRSVTLAALALSLGACAPETSDEERAASDAGAGQDPAAQPERPDYGAAEAGRPDPDTTTDAAEEALADAVGKMVVDADGQLLGTTQRIVTKPKSEEKFAVIAVSGTTSVDAREVVVPMQQLDAAAVPGKLRLQMSKQQLLEQPDVAEGDYVALEKWMTGDEEVPAAEGRGGMTSRTDN